MFHIPTQNRCNHYIKNSIFNKVIVHYRRKIQLIKKDLHIHETSMNPLREINHAVTAQFKLLLVISETDERKYFQTIQMNSIPNFTKFN
jgi:hypothetical protein